MLESHGVGVGRPLLARIWSVLGTSKRERPEVEAKRAFDLCRVLLARRRDTSGMRVASEAMAACSSLQNGALGVFVDSLAAEFLPDAAAIARAARLYLDDPVSENLAALQQVAESPRQELFRRLNWSPDGTRELIEMRRRLLLGLASKPEWRTVDTDLVHLFRSWFNPAFLVLRQIDWHTSAVVLERLIEYEAVHQIRGWRDLRRRLQKDRRCFALFHPAIPDEPLIFIEVALTKGMSHSIQPLLDPESPIMESATANCALFYSITHCHDGLRGVSFGNFLIEQAVENLGRNVSHLKRFATLSPIHGFVDWLGSVIRSPRGARVSPAVAALCTQIEGGSVVGQEVLAPHQRELTQLCAYYLLHGSDGKAPLDTVARFHLANGARMERLNWLADLSMSGLRRSMCMMVNYVYRRQADHAARYQSTQPSEISASPEFRRHARLCRLAQSDQRSGRESLAG